MKKQVVLTDSRKENRMYEEAIKTLRTNIQFAGANIKVILMSSCFPNEGKSDVAFQLCREFGKINKKVLMVDADIRKSAFVSRYQIKEKIKGLTHYLSGQAEMDEVIYSTNYENVDMIFAGSLAPNPTELLESNEMEVLLKQVREEYDYVIIDTPPVASMSDAMIVARWCDGSLIVIEAERVSYRIAQKVKQNLVSTGCRVLGVILNKVDTSSQRYYGYYGKKYGYYGKYGYGYGYGGYYGHESSEKSDHDSSEASESGDGDKQ